MRDRARLRATADRMSTAPRYLGVTAFATIAGVAPVSLSRWRIDGPIWVPGPDVVLGERRRCGWAAECAEMWTMSGCPVERPEPTAYWDTAQMRRYYGLSYELLWKCVVEDKTLPMPAVWVDDQPGWVRPLPGGSGSSA
ncbi:hypothetical protein [Nocardia donostiensis]|uniref:Uncharacterized protein n=1 Tax=Nocardia donostiensis TaxID=1538463 RepID=A0A1W0B6R8_9NOCA|nr:hypothetical protein [Nocardia donostiensis]ONM46468.1 hypothetical protein B0T46_22825 [Nocardia donostiensis]OQS18131.1 hypothetical protein B0T44_21305 [Nocardia donostiensis]